MPCNILKFLWETIYLFYIDLYMKPHNIMKKLRFMYFIWRDQATGKSYNSCIFTRDIKFKTMFYTKDLEMKAFHFPVIYYTYTWSMEKKIGIILLSWLLAYGKHNSNCISELFCYHELVPLIYQSLKFQLK